MYSIFSYIFLLILKFFKIVHVITGNSDIGPVGCFEQLKQTIFPYFFLSLVTMYKYVHPYRAIFNRVLKVIRDCIGFGSLYIVIGLENSRHPLSQSDAKLKPILTWSLACSRA